MEKNQDQNLQDIMDLNPGKQWEPSEKAIKDKICAHNK